MTATKKILLSGVICSIVLSILFVILKNQFALELSIPISDFLIFLLLCSNLKELGPHKISTLCIGLGIFCLVIGDSLRFYNHVLLNADPYSLFIHFIYVMPTFFFSLNVTIFLEYKLRNRPRDLSHLFVNTFCGAIFGFVLIYKFFIEASGSIKNTIQLSYLIFAFIAFYVCMMSLQIFFLVGRKNIRRGTLFTTSSMLLYEIMDIRYVYTEAIGSEPNNNYTDIIYSLLIFGMALGITLQTSRKYVFDFRKVEYSDHYIKRKLIPATACIAACVLLAVTNIFSRTEATDIIIVLMAYIIMSYLLYTSALNEKQNVLLEKRVEEKTSALKEANDKLEKLSYTDILTGLYNRRFTNKYLDKLCDKNRIQHTPYAVLCIDLNMFKPVNDTFGHEMGDNVLAELGKRMCALPEEFTSFRTGGDEFMIIMEITENTKNVESCVQNVQKIYNTPIKHKTYTFCLSASIGVSLYPNDSEDISELLLYADTAMYSIKHSSNKDGYQFFNKNLIKVISKHYTIKKKLESAIPKDDFVLYYQPQVNVETGEIMGVETYPHLIGDMENISPADLIPIAEETGLMSRLGIWIADTSLNQINEWNKKYNKNLTVTINLSPLQLVDTDYSDALEEIIHKLSIPPSLLTLDVANDVIMGTASSAKEAVRIFHDRGYILSLNNFGGDDINLSYVLDCGFRGIKLSRSLISKKADDLRTQTLIKTILAIADNMNILVTAVGIETEEQAETMRSLGIKQVQGYLYGKPVKADEIEKLLIS